MLQKCSKLLKLVSALDRYAVLSLREKALCGMSLKRHLGFIPICDVTINNCDLVVTRKRVHHLDHLRKENPRFRITVKTPLE